MGRKRDVAARLAVPARAYVRYSPGTLGKPFLVRRLLEPALRKTPRDFVTTTVDGTRLAGSTQDMIQRYVYVFGVWEPDLTAWLRSRLTSGRTFVDVGANIGYFTVLGASLVGPTGRVVAVEALPTTYDLLRRNLALNSGAPVRALNVAATREAGIVTLYGGELHNSGTTSTVATPGLERLIDIESAPLATLLTDAEITTTRVVKIDVEGAEAGVLEGLAPVLGALPDDVELVVEVSPADADGPLRLLVAHGFTAYRMHNDYAPTAYARREPPRPLLRFSGHVGERMDLVFSRTDAERLL